MPEPLYQAWHALGDVPHLRLWLTIGWIAYLIGLGGWIVLQKREPVATLSWLVSLAALPYLGFVVYYFFGPQKIERQRLRRERSRSRVPHAVARNEDARELARLALATTGLPPSTAAEARLLIDGSATYPALLEAIAQARESIHLEYYIYNADRIGTAVRDALAARAREGVTVRLLLDAVGCASLTDAFLRPLRTAGAQVAWFHPLRLARFWRRPWLNLRTHRKIVVIDGRIGFTGGINITDEEDDRRHDDAYHDLHLRLEGPVVRQLQLVFFEDWCYATGESAPHVHTPELPEGPIAAQVLTSGPDTHWEAIHRLHVAAIHAARRRVWLVTPYYVPTEAARMALTSAALGGLDVRLMVPRRSDSRVVTFAARSYFDELLQAGVKVYEYGPRLLHTKAMLCDEDLAIIGSANFDNRSFRLNFEVCVMFQDASLCEGLARMIEADFRHAPRVRADRARPLWRARLPEALARLVSPLL